VVIDQESNPIGRKVAAEGVGEMQIAVADLDFAHVSHPPPVFENTRQHVRSRKRRGSADTEFELLGKVVNTQLGHEVRSLSGGCHQARGELEGDTSVEEHIELTPKPAGMETATNAFPQDPAKAGLPDVVARGIDVRHEVGMALGEVACPPQLIAWDIDLEEQRSTRARVTCGEVERTLTPGLWLGKNIGGDARDCGFGEHELMEVRNNLRGLDDEIGRIKELHMLRSSEGVEEQGQRERAELRRSD
jgi:hypothetical protein